MQTRVIGSLHVSVVGLGCNNFGRRIDLDATEAVIRAAMNAGINFFDTADIYGNGQSEEFIGKVLGKRRSQVVIATKFGNAMPDQGQGARPEYIRKAVEASLKRLRTDYIDLYQQHIPDPSVPIAETLGALDELVRSGKVREIGSSNFSSAQIAEAEAASTSAQFARFVTVQNEYSLLQRAPEKDVLPECAKLKLGFLPYFPLASGLLSGKYRKDQPVPEGTRLANSPRAAEVLSAENLSRVEGLIAFAEGRGHTILELAVSWLLRRPEVTSVIAGATKPEQISANVRAANWVLTEAELAEVEKLLA